MGTLMPTWPTSISFWNLRAAARAGEDGGAVAVRVGVDEGDGSSSVSSSTMHMAGPKISWV
jgi:hypothetical protein